MDVTLSNEFVKWLKSSVGNKGKKVEARIKSFCTKYSNTEVFVPSTCRLKEDIEQEFFMALFGKMGVNSDIHLYRYMPFNSLVRTLDEGKVSMCSIVSMNDKTERDYFQKYIKNYKAYNSYIDAINDNLKLSNKDNLQYYITSLMPKVNKDDLDMWRIYGDDARGVMLEYEIPKKGIPEPFLLAHISYAGKKRRNGVIKLIFELMSHSFSNGQHILFNHLDAWQHMFKPYEYHKENKIRLLFVSSTVDKWVKNDDFGILMPLKLFEIEKEYPLKLNSIMLGPKFSEKDTNKDMLNSMLKSKGIKGVSIEESLIYSYR